MPTYRTTSRSNDSPGGNRMRTPQGRESSQHGRRTGLRTAEGTAASSGHALTYALRPHPGSGRVSRRPNAICAARRGRTDSATVGRRSWRPTGADASGGTGRALPHSPPCRSRRPGVAQQPARGRAVGSARGRLGVMTWVDNARGRSYSVRACAARTAAARTAAARTAAARTAGARTAGARTAGVRTAGVRISPTASTRSRRISVRDADERTTLTR
jgi:hypothetical protein